jgi:uncharacterized membrane protein
VHDRGVTKGKDWVDRTFQVGMILKGLDGLLELLGGLLLLLIPPTTIAAVVTWLKADEEGGGGVLALGKGCWTPSRRR